MDVIVLAGGHATRLWPITKHRPKPLLPLGDASILDVLLDDVTTVADEVIVSTNALFEDAFQEAIDDRPKTRLFVEGQTSEEEKPGALGALFEVTREMDPESGLLVVAGDNYYGFDVGRFAKQARANDGPTVAVKALPRREDARSFGVVELEEGTRIKAFHEKPRDPPSNLAATALYHYPPGWDALFEAYRVDAEQAANTAERFDEPGRILEWAIGEGNAVHAWSFEDAWFDIGTPSGYLNALQGVLGSRFVEGTLKDCEEGEGVFVFGDARAESSRMEQTVLLPGARVKDAELSQCIVDSDAAVSGLSLKGSLVGAHDRLYAPGSEAP